MAQAPAALPQSPIVPPISSSWLDTPTQIVNTVVSVAKCVFDEFIKALANIKDDPSTLVKGIKLIGLGIMAHRIDSGDFTWQQPVAVRINANSNLIDTLGIFDDANFFISGKYKEENAFESLSNSFFLKADIGGFMLWLDELKITNFAKLSESFGLRAAYFGTSLTATAGLGFAAMGASSIYKLAQEFQKPNPNQVRIRQNLIKLAWSSAEVASKTLLVLAATNLFVIGGMGLIALSAVATTIGIISFVHSRRFANKINEA